MKISREKIFRERWVFFNVSLEEWAREQYGITTFPKVC